ncbi:MAG: hypothetical protein GY798_02560 [Hyphomicrobiales bacterium]|nr:hypothetical protein [Hyphomicrobiales bacterium]
MKLEKALDWGSAVSTVDNIVRYYFYSAGEQTLVGKTSKGWSAYERGQFALAFETFETFLDLEFEKVGSAAAADFGFATRSGNDPLGQMSPPGEGSLSGFGEFFKKGTGWNNALEQGGFGFITIIHELGHGLGLAHPHDKGGTSGKFPGVSDDFGDYGKHGLNQGIYTMMSYNDGWKKNPDGAPSSLKYGYEGTPMALDIAVLQAKYGADTEHNTGNDTYKLPKSNDVGTFYSAIWDAGGTDAIKYGGSRPALIDLRAATLNVEPGGGGFLSYAYNVHGGFTIANGVVIENALGGAGDDYLSGNDAGNSISGGAGKDVAKGRGGADSLKGDKGKDKLNGGSGGDELTGGKGSDSLKGKSGADILNGGRGADKLTGGPGADAFVFGAEPGGGQADEITDFEPGADVVHLMQSVFPKAGVVGGLAASAFHIGKKAADAGDRIVYNDANGKLIYDKNGSDSGGSKMFAFAGAGLAISHEDFVIVA